MAEEKHVTPADGRRRRDTLAVVVGLLLTVVGAVGVVLGFADGRTSATAGSGVWLLIGLVVLVFGARARRRTNSGQDRTGTPR